MNEKLERIVELFAANPEIENVLKACKSKEECVDVFAQNGISVSVEDLVALSEAVNSDELSEEILSLVAGGSWKGFWKGVKDFFKGFADAF